MIPQKELNSLFQKVEEKLKLCQSKRYMGFEIGQLKFRDYLEFMLLEINLII